ncbi:MAG: hypothetical protein JST87_17735 [Bacteroidetes bacterium]|nr:hypothetical protein [Bacteroidota bacterium]
MEVHHHPKVEKKNFKEYLLEGLMIFLAVTMGFFAESLREHLVNNDKRTQYVESLIEDLMADTASLGDVLQFDEAKLSALGSMYQCYDTVIKNLTSNACMGILVKYSKVNRSFQLDDRTLTQLGSTGDFRLLEKEDADSIMSYQRFYKHYYDFQATIYQEAQDNVRNTLNDLADFKVNTPLQNVSNMTGNDIGSDVVQGSLLFSADKALVNKWFNELQLYVRVINAQHILLTQMKTKATKLIQFYKSKHHLE